MFKVPDEIPENCSYLAHPFSTREWVREWELKLEGKLGIMIINPFYDMERSDVFAIDQGLKGKYDVDPNVTVNRDVNIIKKCVDVLTFITGDMSYGTIQEMVYGKLLKKPNYSLIMNGQENHPWLRYHSTKIFTQIEDLEKFLTEIKTKK